MPSFAMSLVSGYLLPLPPYIILGDVDYVHTETTLIFPSGTQGGARLTFSVPIIDDNIAEYREDFTVTATVHGDGIGIYTRLIYSRNVRIRDNDGKLRTTYNGVNFLCLSSSLSLYMLVSACCIILIFRQYLYAVYMDFSSCKL